MAEGSVVRLYDRRLYNDQVDTLLKKRHRNAFVYSTLARADEHKVKSQAGRAMIAASGKASDVLKNISDEWEKAGDYEKKKSRKRSYYERALAAAEHLSVMGSGASELRVMLKMKRNGLIEDIDTYMRLRRQKPFLFKDFLRS